MTMESSSDSWRENARIGATLASWRIKIGFRMAAYQVRHTVQGKFGVFAGSVMAVIFVRITAGGYFKTLPGTQHGIDGFLLVAHIWLAVPLALMFLTQFAKSFVKKREEEPLVAHAALFPVLARHRVVAALPHTTLTFVLLFYAYFWQPLASRLDLLWLAIPIHLLTTINLAVATAIVMGAWGRCLLRYATSRGVGNANLYVNLPGGIGLAVFLGLLVGILTVNKHAPDIFEAIGNSPAVSIPIGMIPYAAALAADEGRWLALLGWFCLSLSAAFWAIRATYRWSFSAHREIPIDLATPVKRLVVSLFTGRSGRWLPLGLTAFWRKDIVVTYSREPRRYFAQHVNFLWWALMAVILAVALRNRGDITPAFAETVPVFVVVLSMALVAMQNGVNALGREGKELTWLRPIFSGTQLLGRKLLVNGAYVLVHSVAYTLVVFAASYSASLHSSFGILLLYAVCSGAVFTCIATTIGFLLPDFERRRSTLPGSTTVGKLSYLGAAMILSSMTGVAHLLLTADVFNGSAYAGFLGFLILCVAVGAGLIATAGIRLYKGLEI